MYLYSDVHTCSRHKKVNYCSRHVSKTTVAIATVKTARDFASYIYSAYASPYTVHAPMHTYRSQFADIADTDSYSRAHYYS